MIKFVEWLLGSRQTNQLRAETFAAESDVETSQAARDWAERVGAEQRARLAANHFGEGFAAAFNARKGWSR